MKLATPFRKVVVAVVLYGMAVTDASTETRDAAARGARHVVAKWSGWKGSRTGVPATSADVFNRHTSVFKPRTSVNAMTAFEAPDSAAALVTEKSPFAGWKSRLFPSTAADDELTLRARLMKTGISALLSYGLLSSSSVAVVWSMAWFAASKRTGLSPIAPGQWKGFLAVYTGFFVIYNLCRPLIIAASIASAPLIENIVAGVEQRMNVSRNMAIGTAVFFLNVIGPIVLFAVGTLLASIAAGVPVRAR